VEVPKLLSNVGNAVQALLGKQPGMDDIVRAARAEGYAVLDDAGIGYTSDEEEQAARAVSFTCIRCPVCRNSWADRPGSR
jgi:2-dehydropantoate 2-reductase